jgi:hypothetical protein
VLSRCSVSMLSFNSFWLCVCDGRMRMHACWLGGFVGEVTAALFASVAVPFVMLRSMRQAASTAARSTRGAAVAAASYATQIRYGWIISVLACYCFVSGRAFVVFAPGYDQHLRFGGTVADSTWEP